MLLEPPIAIACMNFKFTRELAKSLFQCALIIIVLTNSALASYCLLITALKTFQSHHLMNIANCMSVSYSFPQ